MLFLLTPGPEFRENSRATGPRSLKGRPQGSDPPLGVRPVGRAAEGRRGGVPGRRPCRWGEGGVPGLGAEGVPGGGSGGCAGAASFRGGGRARRRRGKTFFEKGPTRMYKEALAPGWARLVDKAIFPAILWWV